MIRVVAALAALVLACFVHADNVARTSIVCPDGTYVTTQDTTDCLPYFSSFNFGDELADTSTNTTGVVNKSSGTAYAYIDNAGDAAPVDCAAVQAAVGAVDSTSKTITSNSVVLDGLNSFTGLTAETNYKSYGCAVEGVRIGKVTATDTRSTLATPGGGGSDLTGQGQFIALADGGNTDETPIGTAGTATSGCTSMANSCSQFSHLGTPSIGGNVYLCEGCVWEDEGLTITTGGTSGDPAVWGCYFDEGDDNGNPVLCTSF